MSQFIYLIKQAWASLKKKPAFVATVVTTMGTTLGALLCVLTLGYLLIVEPLPYPEQQRLYSVTSVFKDKADEINAESFTYPGLVHLYKNQDVFEQVALIQYGRDVLTSLPHQPTLNTAYVTPEWFGLLGAKMALGRYFESTEALDTFNPVTILSYHTWQDEYAGRTDILNKKVTFSGVSFTVVGVLSKEFYEPYIKQIRREVGMWMPWDYNLDVRFKKRWGNVSTALTFVGSLKDELSLKNAEQAITPLVNDIWRENVTSDPFFSGWSIIMKMQSFQSLILGDSKRTVHLLLLGVFGLVFIAFANIANLFMSRTAQQQRVLAIYAALGAKRSYLFRGLLAESGLLMVYSILLALVIASVGFYLLQYYLAAALPRINELGMNFMTLMFAVFFVIVFALLFAFLSSKMIDYRALNSTMQSSGKGSGIQVSKRFRQVLVISQISIATLLFFTNISLFKESMKAIKQPMGFSVDNLVHMRLSVSAAEFPPKEEGAAVIAELKSKLLQLPQVKSVSQSDSAIGDFSQIALSVLGNGETFTPEYKEIDQYYLPLIGQALIEGQAFDDDSLHNKGGDIIVNDVLAKRLNLNGSVLGVKLSTGEKTFIIVGVVKGIKMPYDEDIPIRAYLPTRNNLSQLTLKLVDKQIISREQVVSEIQAISHLYALFSLEVLDDVKARLLFTQYTTAATSAIVAIITLFLAGIGLYGILSYGTQMRRFELGTRMAIGAKRKDLVGLIIKDNVWVIMLGVALGLVLMLGIYIGYKQALAAYMSVDLLPMFMATILSITLLSLFACYWPLRKYINQPAIHSLRGSD